MISTRLCPSPFILIAALNAETAMHTYFTQAHVSYLPKAAHGSRLSLQLFY